MAARLLTLDLLPGTFAVARLDPGAAVPAWAEQMPADFRSVTRTADEISIVCPADRVPIGVRAERGWRLLKVQGPLPFELTGVLASIAGPLAGAGVNLFVVSTFETDFALVPDRLLDHAVAALTGEGHSVRRSTESLKPSDRASNQHRFPSHELGEINMSDNDDDYPTCLETYATLRIYPGELDPDSVTERMAIEPSAWQRQGEPIRVMHVPKVAPISGWFLSSEQHVDSRDVRRHVDWLVGQIEAKAAVLRSLREGGSRIDICCKWLSKEGHGGPTLSPAQMRRIADLDLDLWFDVYFASEGDDT